MTSRTLTLLLGSTLALSACSNTAMRSPDNTVAAPAVSPTNGTPQATRYPAALFHQTTSFRIAGAGGHAFSPDSTAILVSSDQSGIFNTYALGIDGRMTPLTASVDAPLYARSYFPDDERVIVQGDQGGNELDHVLVRETDGTLRDLTPGETTKANFIAFSDDGQTLYITTNERDPGSDDLYAYDVDSYERRRVFQNDEMSIGALSPDGRYLALDRNNSSSDTDILLADLERGGEAKLITPHQGDVSHQSLTFTPDGKALVFASDAGGEFLQAKTYDIATATTAPLLQADWDVQYVGFSPSGRYRISAINADALTEATIVDTQTGRELRLDGLPEGEIGAIRFNADETRLVMGVNTDTSPVNVFTADLTTGQVTRLTDALPAAIDESDLVNGRVIRYASFDGLDIPAILYLPKGASADAPVPALVWVHGGPGGQSTRGYSAMFQHWLNNGYAVLAANNRGSSGYGKTFFHMDDRRHGQEDLRDIVAAHGYLTSLPEIDGERIGVSGASYGGFMTVAALAFHPEVFDVGVNIFGVTNWDRTLKSIPPFWGAFRTALYDEMGDPATDTDRHRAMSPLFSADAITKPLYVMQGANDPRVLQIESDELVAAVKANGVPVDYVLFDDEGHGIEKRANRIENSERIMAFLDTYLR